MWKDKETIVDLLDFEYLVNVAKTIILDEELTPSTIGIYGDWGSGKSSLMEMLMTDLSKETDVICLKFNGWLFEDYEDAKTSLIVTILEEINEHKSISEEAKDILKRLYKNINFTKIASKVIKVGLDFAISGGLFTTINSVKGALSNNDDKEEKDFFENIFNAFKSEEIVKNVKTFHNDFELLLEKTKIRRLIVFIDELDRCKHETILDTLEAIRLFLFAKGTSFIIGADERQIRYAVQMKYPTIEGNQIDIGKEYLEKLIQYPIRIPQLGKREVEFYITCLLLIKQVPSEFDEIKKIIMKEKEKNFLDFEFSLDIISKHSKDLADKVEETLSLSKQLSSVLSEGLNGNPRHCKRFLNTMELRIMMANHRNIKLDRNVLGKLMLVEYFKDDFYKNLALLQAKQEGKPKELERLEKNEWENVEALSEYKDDPWIHNWLSEIAPSLLRVDLRPYFYFSRESQKSLSTSNISNLSSEGLLILQNLMNGSDFLRNEALKKSKSVNDYEATLIFKKLAIKIETSPDIETQLFKSLIEWGGTRNELFVDTVSFLERLPEEKISIPFIPLIPEFANKLSDKSKIKMILKKWGAVKKFKSAVADVLNKIK